MADPWRKRVERIGNISAVSFIGFDGNVFVVIYCIEDDGTPIYVGSTAQPIRQRIRAHLADASRGSDLPVHAWMRSHNFKFQVRLLEVVLESNRVSAERRWMASFAAPLLNVTDGGPGMSGHRFAGSEHAKRIGSAIRTGAYCDCETCGKSFWRKLKEIKLRHNRFCSKICYQTWQRGKPKKQSA